MKKITSLLLALVMALALAVPAFAVDLADNEVSGSKSQDVTAGYTAPESKDAGHVYYFTLSWTQNANKDLAYEGENATYTWSGSDMKYIKTTNNKDSVGWKGSNGYVVEVSNQSNDGVTVTTSASNTYKLDLTKPDNETVTLGSAAVTGEGEAKKDISYTDVDTKGSAQTANFTYTYTHNTTADAPAKPANNATTVTVGTISVSVSHT